MDASINLKEISDFYRREGKREHHQRRVYSLEIHKKRMRLIKTILLKVIEEDAICLDIGCAEGWYTSWFAKRAAFSVGIDLSLPKLKRAMRQMNNAKTSYICANWDYLPFKNKAFDVVLFSDGPEHSLSPKATMKELSHIIENNGYLLTSTTTNPLEAERNPFEDGEFGHLWWFSPESLINLVEEAGFKVLENYFPWRPQKLTSKSYVRIIAFIRRTLKKAKVLNVVPQPLKGLIFHQTTTSQVILGIKRGEPQGH